MLPFEACTNGCFALLSCVLEFENSVVTGIAVLWMTELLNIYSFMQCGYRPYITHLCAKIQIFLIFLSSKIAKT